jgi:hypothetical protein
MNTPLDKAQEALVGLTKAVSDFKARHSQASAENQALQARAQAAENAVVALTDKVNEQIQQLNSAS